MTYLVIKSLHIIFVVTWFAGLFYIFRLFVYHAEAASKTEPARSVLLNQYQLMEKRLWYVITWPSCILTLIFGSWMLVLNPSLLTQPWMYLKIFFVVLLVIYQLFGHRVLNKLANDPTSYSSFGLRIWNEVATIILIAVVFLVVLKDEISWIWGTVGIIGIALLMFMMIRSYRNKREKQKMN